MSEPPEGGGPARAESSTQAESSNALTPARRGYRQIAPYNPNATIPNYGTEIAAYVNCVAPWDQGNTVQEWLTELSNCTNPHQQKNLVDGWLNASGMFFDQVINMLVVVANHLKQNEQLMEVYGGVEAFTERYPILGEATMYQGKRHKEFQSALKWLNENRGSELARHIVPHALGILFH